MGTLLSGAWPTPPPSPRLDAFQRLSAGASTAPALRPPATLAELDQLFERFFSATTAVAGLSHYTAHNFQVAYRSFRVHLATQVPDDTALLGTALQDIDGWIATLRTRPRPAGAHPIHTYWRSVRSFFGYVEHLSGLPTPFAGHRPPRLPDRVPKARTQAECARILLAVENYPGWTKFERARNSALIGMALYAGLRRGDLLRLLYTNVDLQERTIRVEGGKGRGGGKDRVVMMAPELHDLVFAPTCANAIADGSSFRSSSRARPGSSRSATARSIALSVGCGLPPACPSRFTACATPS